MAVKLLLSILFIPLVIVSFSQDSDSTAAMETYSVNPFEFAADQVIKNKIVMLGENGALGHYNLFPHLTLISVLESWQKKTEADGTENKTLTLIIEKSPSAVSLIQNYIDTGDLQPFIEKHGNTYSLEDLYLFYRISEINRKIINSGNKLKLLGFEINERYNDEFFFQKSDYERAIFFAKERDSLLFKVIKDYIYENSDEQILMYYGGVHLSEKLTQKINPSESYDGKGYYIAYYLRREYGKERFITFDQTYFFPELYDKKLELKELKNKSYLIKKGDPIFKNDIDSDADWVIVKHDGPVGPHFIRSIFSIYNLQRNYKKLSEYENLSKKYNQSLSLKQSLTNNPVVSSVLQSIKLITGREFNTISDYKACLDSSQNKFLHDKISNQSFSKELFTGLQNNSESNDYRYLLYSLGAPYLIIFHNYNPTEIEWNDIWKDMSQHLNYFDCVGLYWFGTDTEKPKAKEFLIKRTGENYHDPANYLEWYYKNIFGYNFN